MGYWDATDEYLSRHRHGPICPQCGKEMFPKDDHGRFSCLCSLESGIDVTTGEQLPTPDEIPQVDTSGMTDKEKAKIPPINRLYSAPTAAEAELNQLAARGLDCMDDPEYWRLSKKIEEEREE